MVIIGSTGLGLLLVNSITALSDFLPSILTSILPATFSHPTDVNYASHTFAKREELSETKKIVFGCLIPVLVILSGVFAGLTLGYMSLDETQLNVLSISGTPEQKRYAEKIKPIRHNGHLLLVTLLLSNMIVNETLPVIADPVLGGGFQGVVVSTVLIVLFAEVIPQSICTRYGLWVGAKMAPVVRVLLWTVGIIAWPVAKLLEIVLGPHHGIIYRRTELKELIAMHSSTGQHGGDLKNDTVAIIGATLDLQEKVVRQAMTPIKDVFMLSINSKLDYETLRKICGTGHSRVPVYEEVEVSTSGVIEARNKSGPPIATPPSLDADAKTMIVKRIVGILLVKQCVLLDPSDATPLRLVKLNKVPFVPNNEPLLGILDKFQEGRSHMAIVSRFSVEKAKSFKKAVKHGLTQRIRQTVGISDDSSSSSSSSESEDNRDDGASIEFRASERKPHNLTVLDGQVDQDATLRGNPGISENDQDGEDGDGGDPEAGFSKRRFRLHRKRGKKHHRKARREKKHGDIESGEAPQDASKNGGFGLSSKEQILPADAVLPEENANEFLQISDPAIMPLGIITLEDVLEELIGEEIYDEFDPHHQGAQLSSFVPPDADSGATVTALNADGVGHNNLLPSAGHDTHTSAGSGPTIVKPIALRAKEGFGALIGRSKSAPPMPMDQVGKRPPSKSSVPPRIEDGNDIGTVNEETSVPHLDLPNPHPMNQMTTSGGGSQLPRSQPQTPKLDSALPQTAHLTPVTPPRFASPGSLEAYLFERKRRGVSGGAASPRIVTPTPGGKGKFFKSNPLDPAERDTTDGVKSAGTSDVAKEGDGNGPVSECVVDNEKPNSVR